MNMESIVEVEYEDSEHQTWLTVGELREGKHHCLLISETIEGLDLCTYTIIPKNFVRKITPVKFK
jgi:hypothetical protein